jgi:hypothetical protein
LTVESSGRMTGKTEAQSEVRFRSLLRIPAVGFIVEPRTLHGVLHPDITCLLPSGNSHHSGQLSDIRVHSTCTFSQIQSF